MGLVGKYKIPKNGLVVDRLTVIGDRVVLVLLISFWGLSHLLCGFRSVSYILFWGLLCRQQQLL